MSPAITISIEEVAEVAGLSTSYIMRAFQRQTGISIHTYLIGVRLRHAREMLIHGDPAAEVAYAVGFVDQSHLIRRFKGVYGTTPGRYARESWIAQQTIIRGDIAKTFV